MSKPRPTPAEQIRAISDEMCVRLNAILVLSQAAAGGESGQFVVVAIAPDPDPETLDVMMAYGPFDHTGASMVADALTVRFAASGAEGVVVRVVPWVAFYR